MAHSTCGLPVRPLIVWLALYARIVGEGVGGGSQKRFTGEALRLDVQTRTLFFRIF